MSNIDIARHLISSISGQDNYLTVNRIFVKFMGSLEGGIFLQQLIFWSDKTQATDKFFYKSYVEWEEEICLSEYSIRKQTKILKEKGLLITKLKKANGSPTVHYKLDISGFLNILESFLKNSRMETENLQNEYLNISVSSYTEEYNRRIQQKTTSSEPMMTTGENPFTFYQENIGRISGFIAEQMDHMINESSEELLLAALKVTVLNGAKNIKYTQTVLNNWAKDNITTVEQVEALNNRKENGHGNKVDSKNHGRNNSKDKYSGLGSYSSDI